MCIFLCHASVSWLGFNWCQLGWPGMNSRVRSSDHSGQFGVWSASSVSQKHKQSNQTHGHIHGLWYHHIHSYSKEVTWLSHRSVKYESISISKERIQIFSEQYSKHCEWVCLEDRAEKGKNICMQEVKDRGLHFPKEILSMYLSK